MSSSAVCSANLSLAKRSILSNCVARAGSLWIFSAAASYWLLNDNPSVPCSTQLSSCRRTQVFATHVRPLRKSATAVSNVCTRQPLLSAYFASLAHALAVDKAEVRDRRETLPRIYMKVPTPDSGINVYPNRTGRLLSARAAASLSCPSRIIPSLHHKLDPAKSPLRAHHPDLDRSETSLNRHRTLSLPKMNRPGW